MLKRNLIPIIILIIIIAFIIQPNIVSEGFSKGVNIWANNIVPYLFPISIFSNILLQYNLLYSLLERFSYISIKLFKGKFALIPYFISFVSGYPSGALVTNILVNNKRLTSKEANYYLFIANNCSFQFIAGAVSYSMLGDFNYFFYIAIPHFLGALILSLLFRNDESKLQYANGYKVKPLPFNQVFSSSLSKSISSILSVGAVIIIFSIFAQFIIKIISSYDVFTFLNTDLQNIVYSLLVGLLEITNGCSIISKSAVPIETKLIIINFLISFSGMSITFQTIAVTSDFHISLGKYIKARFLFGIISAMICIIMLIIM